MKSRIIAALAAMLIICCNRVSAQGAVINAADVSGSVALDQTNFNFGSQARMSATTQSIAVEPRTR